MKTTTMNWLLAGALVASLQWNLRLAWSEDPPAEQVAASVEAGAEEPASGSGMGCSLALDGLGLSDEQSARLASLCASECTRAGEDEAAAEAKLRELQGALAAERLDEGELRRLVRAISALRERSLTTCVDSVLAVRSILDREQLHELLEGCCAPPAAPR